ncbi:DUF4136 domain-containing protein [Xanthomarina sp. F1114]|uniref:DUF4136 domain-containing protein n=1 Tax=Xanthomarina sp. F1114 TaxID=2996019 RepID=UPI00225E639F|nr:DUF4136 domain-containing protein [Xanthomarina sp. F1114]MCX7546641.1 DUF4136 domain-containing protein [Xanthomarina sp. F1114]
MKTLFKTLSILFATLMFTANAHAQVKSDYDKNTDFSKYKTISFKGWQEDSDKKLTDFDKKRITDALTSEFSKRGVTLVESDADAAITLYIVVNKKTSTTAYTTFNGGMGYRGRWGWGMGAGMGMGAASTTYNNSDYLEGTFVVDMYDTNNKNLIWQGVITSEVNEKPKKRKKSTPRKIAKLMKSYPVKLKK